MDFKSKGIAWVGDIYQRFETVCHEVDNIVGQDPVKYVENQVHTVGKSMKKFCSEVVQAVEPVKCEAQAVALKGNAAVGDYIKSMIGIEEDRGHEVSPVNQLLIEPKYICTVKNRQPCNASSGCDLVNQSTIQTSEESLEGKNSDSALGRIDVVSINGNSDFSCKEDSIKEEINAPEVLVLVSPDGRELSNTTLSSDSIDSNDENACVSSDEVHPSTSADLEEFQSPPEVEKAYYSLANHSDAVSDASGSVVLSEFINSNNDDAFLSVEEILSSSPVVGEEFQFPEKVGTVCYSPLNDSDIVPSASGAVLLSELIDSKNENACGSKDDTSPSTSMGGEELQTAQKVGTVCYSHWEDETVSDASSAVAISELNISVASSCGSIFTEPRTMPENSFNDSLIKVALFANSVSISARDSDSTNLLMSSTSTSVVSSDNEVAETALACSNSVLSFESAGCSYDSCYISDDFEGYGMETIDLSEKMKLEESCVVVDDSMLHEASRRIHKLRSFKKKFQDVFNSKKRLNKEYEQIAIWFGDLDTEPSQSTAQHQLPISTSLCLDPQLQTHDCEWELL